MRLGVVLAAIGLAVLGGPAGAAVWEVGDDGSFARLAAVPTPRHSGEGRNPATPQTLISERVTQLGSGLRQNDGIRGNDGGGGSRAAALRPAVETAARSYEVSPALVDAIAHVESRYDARAVSRAGASGVMQLMPATARALGVDAAAPEANIRGGTAYLRQLLDRFDGNLVLTVAAYNAGPGAVARAGGVPAFRETRAYVAAVMDRLAGAAR